MRNRPDRDFARLSHEVMDALPLGIVVLDADNVVTWASRGWSAVQNWHVDSVHRIDVGDEYAPSVGACLWMDGEYVSQIVNGIGAVRNAQRANFTVDCPVQLGDATRWLQITILPVGAFDPGLVMVTHQEITGRKDLERSLGLFRDAVASMADQIIIADADGRIEFANTAFNVSNRLATGDIRGSSLWAQLADDADTGIVDDVWVVLRAGEAWRGDVSHVGEQGERRWESFTVSALRNNAGQTTHLIAVGRDVTEQRTYIDDLRRHAYHDGLTGLPNRMLFIDRLNHAHTRVQRNNQPLAVMFLDLNGFKSLNDRFGHQTGDVVLAEVAKRLVGSLRASDTVARTGGDEFIFLLEDVVTDDDALAVGRRIIADVSRPLEIGDALVSISASIGIAFNSPVIVDPELLLHLADIALYHAKTKSDDRIMIYQENMTMPTRPRL